MDESNFDRLLERYVSGQVTPQEKKKIEAWFEVRKSRGDENAQLNEQEAEFLFEKITSNIDNEKEIRSLRPKTSGRKRRQLTIGIAASIVALIAVTAFILNYDSFINGNLASSTERLILKDGSIVWLRGTSSFKYYEAQDGSRHGVLSGEALFEIAKDPLHPFIITHSSYSIAVLGTSFNLRAASDSLELMVLTGKVRLTTSYDTAGVIVEHLEGVRLVGNLPIEKASFSEQAVTPLIADTQYDMKFTNTDMQSVAERLSEKFNIDFKFSNDRIGNCLVTADFTDHSLESTTAMLAEVLNADFKREGKVILVEGLGCQ
jgi:transmembrane sensor